MIDAVEVVARVLGWGALAALSASVVRSFLPGRRPPWRETGAPSGGAVGCAAVVLLVGVVGLVATQRSGIPLPVSAGSVAGFALLLVLLRRDERGWAVLALLAVVGSVVGRLTVLALAHDYDTTHGGWSGSRLLTAWAGPAALPDAPHAAAAAVALATIGTGLPFAVAGTVAWLLVGRRSIGRLDTVALGLVAATELALVVSRAAVLGPSFARGAMGGIPFSVGLLGMLVTLVVPFTLGPALVAGLLVGGRRLLAGPAPDTGHDLVSTLSGAGEVRSGWGRAPAGEPVVASVWRLLRGPVAWVQRLNIVVMVLAVLLVGLLGLSSRAFLGDPHTTPVSYGWVSSQVAVPGGVARVLRGPSGLVWLLTGDHRLETFDPAYGTVSSSSLPVIDARGGPGAAAVVAVSDEPAPRLLLVTAPSTSRALATFAPGSAPTVAATSTRLYAAARDGRTVVTSPTGKVLLDKKIQPVSLIVNRGAEVWTLHPAATGPGTFTAIRRQPDTLAELAQDTVTTQGGTLVWSATKLVYDVRLGTFTTPAAPARWTTGAQGELTLAVGTRRTRYDLAYDRVLGVFETSAHGTWVVVDDGPGQPFSPTSEGASYVVRWPGAPGLPPPASAVSASAKQG